MLCTIVFQGWLNEKLYRDIDNEFESEQEFSVDLKDKLSYKGLYHLHERVKLQDQEIKTLKDN